jgi:hypothetical protein
VEKLMQELQVVFNNGFVAIDKLLFVPESYDGQVLTVGN